MSYAEYDQTLQKLRVPQAPGQGILAYGDGGSVLTDDDFLTDSDFADQPTQTQAQGDGQVLSDDDFLTDDDFAPDKPAPEGAVKSFGRAAAHGVVPAAGGLAGAATAAELSLPLAPLAGPLAPAVPVVAGVAGYFGGAYLAGKGQEAVLDATGNNDTEQRQANAEAHPIATTAGDIAPALVTMSPGSLSDALASRVLSGGIMATAEGVQEGLSGQDLDPTKIATAGAVGAVFNRQNRLGAAITSPTEKLAARLKENGASAWKKYAPGRPDTEPTDTSAAEKADAAQSEPIKANTRGNAIEQPAPNEKVTVGAQPDNKPTRDGGNTGLWAKIKGKGKPVEPTDTVAPDIQAALSSDTVLGAPDAGDMGGETPAPAPAAPPVVAPAEPPQPQPATPQNVPAPEAPARVDEPTGIREMFEAKQQAPAPEVLIDADFETHHDRVDRAATSTADEPSDAQKAAGNYEKGHVTAGTDVGLPGYEVSIETKRGGVRRSKERDADGKPLWEEPDYPAHYGQALRTKGADGEPLDVVVDNTGDRRFVVDQYDPATGKFDEHKIITNTAGENTARLVYNRMFSDGSGPSRLKALTEAPDMKPFSDWINNGDKSKPFSPELQEAPPKTTKTGRILRVEGQPDMAVPLGEPEAETRVRTPAGTVEGHTATVRDKADAARKSAALAAYKDAFNRFAPKDATIPTSKEAIAALKDRLTAAVTAVEPELSKHDWSYMKKGERIVGKPYMPPSVPEAVWYKKVKALASAKNLTTKRIADFITSEQNLRGSPEDVANEMATNRIEGGIARSRRSGDDAVASAENEAARQSPFEVGPEDVEADTEPTPIHGAEDLPQEGDREIDITTPGDRDQLAKALAEPSSDAKWAGVKAEQAAAAEAEAAKTARLKALRLAQKGEQKRDLVSSISAEDEVDPSEVTKPLTGRTANEAADKLRHFASDESGSINPSQLMDAVKQSLKMPKKSDEMPTFDTLLSSNIAAHEAPRAGEHKTMFARDTVPPEEDTGRWVDQRLYQRDKQAEDHTIGVHKIANEAVKEYPALGDKAALEDMYRAIERGQTSSLPKAWQEAWGAKGQPALDQNAMIRENLAREGVDIGTDVKNHIMRIPKNNKYDPLAFFKDPIGYARSIPTGRASTLYDRTFNALEDPQTGARHVISLDDDGAYSIWNNFKRTKVNEPIKWEPGGQLQIPIANQPGKFRAWNMVEAYVDEIEKNARGPDGKPMQYYKNPMLSAYLANIRLADQLRSVQTMNELKGSQQLRALAKPPGTPAEKVPDEWREVPKLPNFKGWKFHPDVANALDDYAQPGIHDDALMRLRNINNTLLRSMFMTPTPHVLNVLGHWYASRSWDNFTPKGLGRLASTTPQAIKSVLTQDPTQSLIRQAGGSTMYGGVLARDSLHTLADTFGEHMSKDPERWGPILSKMGMNKPADFVKAIYDGSSHVMWAINDMLVTQKFLENRMKGMSAQGALNSLFRDIPAYRLPTKVMGSRAVSKFMGDNLFASFNRYHYGMLNSWANTMKDLLGKNATTEQRVDAAGKLASIGFAMFVAKPVIDHLVKLGTGNEDAEMHARGPLTIPEGLKQAGTKGDISSLVGSVMPMSPVVQTAEEIKSNKDFAGRPIAKPADLINAAHGSPTAAGRILLDEGVHAAKGVVSPVNTFLNAAGRGQNEGNGAMSGMGTALRDQLLDIKNPSNAARKWSREAPKKAQQALRQDMRRPRDPVERLYDRFFGSGQSHF